MHGYTHDKDAYLKRLRRIEGQVRGLQRMIDEDKYCIDILTQVSAATKALQAVALGLLEDHLGHCVAQAVAEGGDRPPRPLLNRGRRGGQRASVTRARPQHNRLWQTPSYPVWIVVTR
jgi:DNA-binding FrmR family transcriptional regulator